ncbi:hypothetical protein EG339_02695 [Chryseobacterium bernardetii]|uniref:Uncharacterized protein n=1 Tax=Chryseobacterium bernardetii TaxID=1241978 RepID=A0A3G6T2D0_9FLAO|nr:hypothetical protein [Chryseobacterium bernardetii]AZB23605.1 hypothetical protein EG339_02695 [Chryseobacterium bernardetii]
MENTLENKEKFFTQYYGQEVANIQHPFDEDYMGQVDGLFIGGINFLELKPLSSITDEDLLKIAELLSWRKSMSESSIITQTKELLLSQSQTNLYREHWSDIVDKVRELGYAHKWNGISVEKQIEYGWIKLKEN